MESSGAIRIFTANITCGPQLQGDCLQQLQYLGVRLDLRVDRGPQLVFSRAADDQPLDPYTQ